MGPSRGALDLGTALRREPRRSRPASGVRQRLDVALAREATRVGYLDATSGETVSWAEIARQAESWSRQFPKAAVVGLRISRPASFCRAYLAGLAAGVCLAPLDPRATSAELADALERLELSDVVVDEQDAALDLLAAEVNVFLTSTEGLRPLIRIGERRSLAPGIAVLLPTSGTTGGSKLVPLSEAQLLRVASKIVEHHKLTPFDRGYSPLPLFHVNAQVVGVLSTLVAGASLIVDDRFHRSNFWSTAHEFEATWLNLVPAILASLTSEPAPPDRLCRRLRFARSASAPLSVHVLERFEDRCGIGVLETYGMTEAASQIAANPLERGERRPGSVGRPLGVELRVVAADGALSASKEIGAVEIRGASVVEFYLGRDRSPVPARDGTGWLRTGDLGRQDIEGFVYLAGRSDDVINRGGEKAFPREIEEVLRRHPRVQDVAVVGRRHPTLGQEPVAYVVAESSPNEDDEALRDELFVSARQSLSRYKQPGEIVFLESLPKGPTGKILRRELAALSSDASEVDPSRESHDERLGA